MHLIIFFLLFPPSFFFSSLQFCKSSPCNNHSATCASDHLKASTCVLQSFQRCHYHHHHHDQIRTFLYSLDLVGHHHRVFFTDLGSSFSLIVIGAIVLVRISVDAAEKVATATVESCKAHSLAAHKASVLFRFGGVTLRIFTAR